MTTRPDHITTDETLRDDLMASLREIAMHAVATDADEWAWGHITTTDALNKIEVAIAEFRKLERGEA